MITFYGYDRCSTCRKAKQALNAADVAFREVDITEHPPPKKLLKSIFASGEYQLGDLFNRSGVQYRELGMKDRLKSMSDNEALDLLASNGRLCKRPIVSDGERATVGFRQPAFDQTWAGA